MLSRWTTELKAREYLVKAGFVSLLLIAWYLGGGEFLPSPPEVFSALLKQLKLETVRTNALKTAGRVYLSSLIALVVGVVIGTADYFSDTASDIVNTFFYPTQFISEAVLTILAIAILGLNPLIIYIVAVLAIVPDVFVATQVGLSDMDEKLSDLGHVYGHSRLQTFRYIVIPQVLPYIFAGLIRTHATAWDIVATAEVFLATSGLGYLVQNEFRLLDLPDLFALVVIILGAGLLSDRVLRVVKSRIDRRYMHG